MKQFEGGNLAKIESAAEQTAAFALTGHHTTFKPETVSLKVMSLIWILKERVERFDNCFLSILIRKGLLYLYA